jgi:BASS family bile acid:Na+ symporter
MNSILLFLKRWGLVVSMLCGACSYVTFINIEALQGSRAMVSHILQIAQPTLLFLMLLFTFLKVKPTDLHLRKWQLGGLLFQGCIWVLGAVLLMLLPLPNVCRLGMEGFLLCTICPTATAAAVITGKLGGNQGSLTMYIILANLMVSLLFPAMIPLIYQHGDTTFLSTFIQIILKIFPLLFMPFACSILMRHSMPKVAKMLADIPNAAFYLWMTALSIAIAISSKNMHNSLKAGDGIMPQLSIALGSLLACVLQFSFGKWIGKQIGYDSEDEVISSTQGLGQKNTIFSIWCGYTFMDPLSSIAGGFYSIWHNIYNSYQLSKKYKKS